jgi:hypothetical protein
MNKVIIKYRPADHMKKIIYVLYISFLVCGQVQAMDDQTQLNCALSSYAELGDLVTVNALIKAKADANYVDYKGTTALMAAASKGHLTCVQALITANAHVNYTTNFSGDTALIQAAFYDHLPCLQALIAAKANINHRDNLNKDTALTWAAKMDHSSICEALVEALLHFPNEQQKHTIITWLGLNKYRNKLQFLGLGPNFAHTFKPHLHAAIYDQNKQDFKKSIAYQEVNKISDGRTKRYLLEKYLSSKQNSPAQ